jgi:hypothetical protein
MPPLPSVYFYNYNEGPGDGNSPAVDVDVKEAETPPLVLVCARCRQRITTSADRIDKRGAHAHTLTNPEGLRFRIGCFAAATGTTVASSPTTYFSWFAGYAWQIELCTSCAEHLGWLFTSGTDSFHGFILDRLLERDG